MDKGERKEFEDFVNKQADELKAACGYAGEFGDRGAGELLDQMKCYQAGALDAAPPDGTRLGYFYSKWAQAKDPDWAEYQRLRAKFGDKA